MTDTGTNCVSLMATTGMWMTQQCNASLRFVCKKEGNIFFMHNNAH